eukprot:scaffold18112_cov168-Amphora_coffeaeformis.AAC.4
MPLASDFPTPAKKLRACTTFPLISSNDKTTGLVSSRLVSCLSSSLNSFFSCSTLSLIFNLVNFITMVVFNKLPILTIWGLVLLLPFSCAQQTTTEEGLAGDPPRRQPDKKNADVVFLESQRKNNNNKNTPLPMAASASLGRYITFTHDVWSVDDGTAATATTTTAAPLDIIGTSRGYCQVLDDTTTTAATAQCVWTLTILQTTSSSLENDTESSSKLMLHGDTTTSLQDWSDNVGAIEVYNIAGGTGDYEGVAGTVHVTTVDGLFRQYQAYFT